LWLDVFAAACHVIDCPHPGHPGATELLTPAPEGALLKARSGYALFLTSNAVPKSIAGTITLPGVGHMVFCARSETSSRQLMHNTILGLSLLCNDASAADVIRFLLCVLDVKLKFLSHSAHSLPACQQWWVGIASTMPARTWCKVHQACIVPCQENLSSAADTAHCALPQAC
jgi:hypothetical protein